VNSKLQTERLDRLFEAVLTLESVEECYNFFEDLCTPPELDAISQRFHVAELLTQKKIYNEIARITGASTATISRVNRALRLGSDGYVTAIGRLQDKADV